MFKMMVGIVALGALTAASADAACTRRGNYGYGQIYYIGNPFTSAAGNITTSDRVFVFINVNKCLAKNKTYKLTADTLASVSAVVGQTATSGVISLEYSKGASTAVQGSFTTGADGYNVVSWNFTISDAKRNATQFIGTANGSQAEDVGNDSSTGSYGLNNNAPGVWQAQ